MTSITVEELADIESIKQLRYKYMYYLDSWDWDNYASLYTEDGYANFGGDPPFGEYEGREQIREGIEIVGNQFEAWTHWAWNPIIELDGDTGTGRWYFGGAFTFKDTEYVDAGDAWLFGELDESYRRVDDEWKLSRVEVVSEMVAPYQGGFSESDLHGNWEEAFF